MRHCLIRAVLFSTLEKQIILDGCEKWLLQRGITRKYRSVTIDIIISRKSC